MKVKSFSAPVAALAVILSSSAADANVGEAYGFGSRTRALGGAGVAWGADSYAAYTNPAQMALPSNKRLSLGLGVVGMHHDFKPITGIVTQNKFTSDGRQTGDVDNTTYRDTLGQELGLSYRLFPETYNLTFGMVSFLPLNQAAYMDTGEAYVPEYVLYRARTQRPQVEMGVGADVGKGFYFGLGLHVAFSLTSNANVFINTKTNTTSTLRFTSSLKPKAAPYLGVLYAPGEEMQKPFTLGAVFRFPVASENTMTLNSAARVFGNFAAVDFNFMALSALFYDPMALELGSSLKTSAGRFYGQIEYQVWSAFQAPALAIQNPSTTTVPIAGQSANLNISPSINPNFRYVDVVVPRAGWEYQMGESTVLRSGYAYRPSMLSDVPNGSGNYLDPPKHMVNLGLGLEYAHFLSFETPCRLDFNLAYQYLITQTVTKSAGNELGDASDAKIGAPGYTAGGSIYGGGVTLSLAF